MPDKRASAPSEGRRPSHLPGRSGTAVSTPTSTPDGHEHDGSPWTASDRLADLLCRRFAQEVQADPSLLDAAREVTVAAPDRVSHPTTWRTIIDRGVDDVVRVLTSGAPQDRWLKTRTPFRLVVALPESERLGLVARAYTRTEPPDRPGRRPSQ